MTPSSLIALIPVLWQVAPVRFLMIVIAVFLVCFWGFTAYKVRREERGHLHWYEWLIGGALGLVGGMIDVALNYTLLTLIYGEMPESGDYTITKRVNHYQRQGRRWREGHWMLGIIRRGTTRVIRVVANWIEPDHIIRRRHA